MVWGLGLRDIDPNNEESNGKKKENELGLGVIFGGLKALCNTNYLHFCRLYLFSRGLMGCTYSSGRKYY